METFTKPKALIDNPQFMVQRRNTLAGLTDGMIDQPIIELINELNRLPYCFTLQCCHGHFVREGGSDLHNLEPLPERVDSCMVHYRMAYMCLCIENSESGIGLLKALSKIPDPDPEHIQFCSAEWFWKKQVNSYALQVQPDRFKRDDTAMLEYEEALRVERVRNDFFNRLFGLIRNQKRRSR